MASMRPSAASPRMSVGIVPSSPPRSRSTLPDPASPQRIHVKRRSTVSSATAILEGLLSAAAIWTVWKAMTFVLPGDQDAFSCLLLAMRSGACLALSTPFLVIVLRGVMLAFGHGRWNLSFGVPRGTDEHEVLDLYLIGAAAGVLGVCIPAIEELGHCAGAVLKGTSVVWIVLAVLVAVPAMYQALGACLGGLSPTDGVTLGSAERLESGDRPSSADSQRPSAGMRVLCGLGHLVLVTSCFYSPDVHGAMGYIFGFVHMMRLLKLAFAFPGN